LAFGAAAAMFFSSVVPCCTATCLPSRSFTLLIVLAFGTISDWPPV
jgi:hypothetical protein